MSAAATTIPGPDGVTARWLEARLREAGYADLRVRGFTTARIGTGQIGTCIRYTLDLDGAGPDAPRSVVAKFPSDDPLSRQTGVQLGNYRKEVAFYQKLQSRLSIRTPRCYFAAIDGDGPSSVLLLEDLHPAEQGDQLRGCTPEIARAAVLELVGLHAPTWCDDTLRGLPWLGEPSENTVILGRALYRAKLAEFLERYGSRVATDEARLIEAVADSQGPPFDLLRGAWSLVHIDYRLDNLLIDASSSPPAVCAVDWQSITLGSPLSDVAYFLGAGLLPETRRATEREIVRAYHGRLCAAGVSGYDWEACWNDYRRGAFSGIAVTVIASVMVVETLRGNEMFTAMARRHARHALDLGAEEFLR